IHAHVATEAAAVLVALEVGRDAGEVLPRRAGAHRLFEQGDRGRVGAAADQRPGAGHRGEVADFLVLLAGVLARLLAPVPRVDRVHALRRRLPGSYALGVARQLRVGAPLVHGA